jgi:hypothetical protein
MPKVPEVATESQSRECPFGDGTWLFRVERPTGRRAA